MHLNIFSQCSPSPQFEGLWRDPEDGSGEGYRSLDYWAAIARQLEEACIDALFFADVHGAYDVYRGSWKTAVRHAVQIPSIDPVLVIPALATLTRHLGFAVTYSTTYHPPYECARLFSSLDHLTGGRIAWNIVTSYLESAAANGLGEFLRHDERYERADEYMLVVRALWERSWSNDAVVREPATDLFTDPDKVFEINHRGRWFDVRGPHQCEPSLQRTPVLYQAGASERGAQFAARHAEVVFLTLPYPDTGAEYVANLRSRAEKYGRSRKAIKALQAGFVLIGADRSDLKRKVAHFNLLTSAEGELAKWCGWMGFDLAAYPDDTPIAAINFKGSRSVLDFVRTFDSTREWTVGDVRSLVLFSRRPHRRMTWFYGTPDRVADIMEEWINRAGVDGFNLIPCPPTSGINDICQLLVPELRRRGLFRKSYDPSERTLRERYFGVGHHSWS